MKRKNLLSSFAASALVLGVAVFSAAPTFAHGSQGDGSQMGHGYSQGMMGSHGMMGSYGQGHGMMASGGAPCGQQEQSGVDRNLGVDDVRGIIESRLKMHGNDRLKVGKVEAQGEDTIVAEIVTVDDSLVNKIEFNTKTGAHHPVK